VPMKSKGHCIFSISLIALLFTFIFVSFASCQELECSAAKGKWEQAFNDLRTKLQDFTTIQQTPVDHLTQKPILERNEGKTIARMVSEALQVKEEMLNAKRKDCRNLMNSENQAFNEFQECGQNGKGSKDKDIKNLVKKRQAFVEKMSLTLSEVKEVEGKESASYAEGYQGDPYRRSVNNYWQNNYQQMYRRWWGQ
jgi:PBP1b-binding outer membrane lipoprotein LpoB